MGNSPPVKIPYDKPWLSVADQLARLESRGLRVTDRSAAEAFLGHINYYRFSGYCLAFEDSRHVFLDGVTFDQVRNACNFDASLRDLCNEALEVIEIDLRTAVAHHFGKTYQAFGHTLPESFHPMFDKRISHRDWLSEIRKEVSRSKEMFIRHFESKYEQFPDLPAWVLTEVMTFGSLARMIRAMHKHDRQKLAAEYCVSAKVLFSLVLHLNYIRNLCAHHSRLWDRMWSIQADLPDEPEWQKANKVSNQRLFSSLLLMRVMLRRSPHLVKEPDEWRDRVSNLLQSPPAGAKSTFLMGLPENWQSHPVWK